MLLKDLPKNERQTVHPFPWLFARAQQGDEYSAQLLETEVAGRFVWDGGHVVYVQPSGNWYCVAEALRRDGDGSCLRALLSSRDLAERALGAEWVGTRGIEGVREALAQALEPSVSSSTIF